MQDEKKTVKEAMLYTWCVLLRQMFLFAVSSQDTQRLERRKRRVTENNFRLVTDVASSQVGKVDQLQGLD